MWIGISIVVGAGLFGLGYWVGYKQEQEAHLKFVETIVRIGAKKVQSETIYPGPEHQEVR